jgi:DNA-binding XRE family transcriptional regulator
MPERRRIDQLPHMIGFLQSLHSVKPSVDRHRGNVALRSPDSVRGFGGPRNDGRAMMGKSQIIHTDGEDLIVIARSDYEALLARAGDEVGEDAMTARIVDATDAKIARGEDVALPGAVWDAIESGEHPIRAIRKHRDRTQTELAGQVGLRPDDIADIESGKKSPSAASLKAIAAALGVPPDILEG